MLNIRLSLFFVGINIMGFSVFMLVPLVLSVIEGTQKTPFLLSFGITVVLGWTIKTFCRQPKAELRRKDGLFVVVCTWFGISVLGALPFLFSQTFGPFCFSALIDAVFESASGFTTTGATVVNHIESLPSDVLLWRSLTQWIGGMGIILLAVAILPFLGVGGLELFKAEVPGPTKDKLRIHVRETATTLWRVYVLLTAACIGALWVAGMPIFDAVCHSLTTLATGGYSVKNASIGAYQNPVFEWIIVFFMLAAASSFVLHDQFRKRLVFPYLRDGEFRVFFGLVLGAALLIVLANGISSEPENWHDAIRGGVFQVVSILTTTGFGTSDYGQWPLISQAVLLGLMIIGGCSGSTAGGIKVVRLAVVFRHAVNEIRRLIHPQSVSVLKFNYQPVLTHTMQGIFGFLTFYSLVFFFAFLVVSGLGSNFETSFGAVLSCLSNVGPGFGAVGPTENYAFLHPGAKTVLALCMILGRLELITFVTLCFPEYWRK